MEVTVVLDHKFLIDQEGRFCAHTMFGEAFWQRYLEVFERVHVVCRARDAAKNERGLSPITNPKVEFHPVPYYEGPGGFIRKFGAIRRVVHAHLPASGAVILRVPQILPNVAFECVRKRSVALGVEVVGDPWDVYAPGAESHVLRPLFRRLFYRRLRSICRSADCSSYVTEYSLQRRYPPKAGSFTTHASSVELREVVQESRCEESFGDPLRLVCVGAMNRMYKGQDVLLRALARCESEGYTFKLNFIGDGQFRSRLQKLAHELGVSHHVSFAGALPFGAPVLAAMDQSDLFVLPSRQEGLPRALLEAMSRGLPCVASDVGGIGEVLEPNFLVKPGDDLGLARKLKWLGSNRQMLVQQSIANLRAVRGFLSTEIEPRRRAFFAELLSIAEDRSSV